MNSYSRALIAAKRRTTVMAVKPPLVDTLKSCGSPAMNCLMFADVSNVTAPIPAVGPPFGSYPAVGVLYRYHGRFASVENCARPGTRAIARAHDCADAGGGDDGPEGGGDDGPEGGGDAAHVYRGPEVHQEALKPCRLQPTHGKPVDENLTCREGYSLLAVNTVLTSYVTGQLTWLEGLRCSDSSGLPLILRICSEAGPIKNILAMSTRLIVT